MLFRSESIPYEGGNISRLHSRPKWDWKDINFTGGCRTVSRRGMVSISTPYVHPQPTSLTFSPSQNWYSILILTGMYRTLNCSVVCRTRTCRKHLAHTISPPVSVPTSKSTRGAQPQLVSVSSLGTETPPMVGVHAHVVLRLSLPFTFPLINQPTQIYK